MEEVWKDIALIPYHQAEWPYHVLYNVGKSTINDIRNKKLWKTEA